MSSDETKLEAAYENLMEENIKSQLEKNGTMAILRSEMHIKVLQMMRGQQDMSKKRPLTGGSANLSPDRSLIKLINQLVMEFFHWYGYRHTLETFRMETGESAANRSEMEQSLLLTPDSKDLPLLAQLVMRDWKLNPDASKVDPLHSMSERCRKLREELEDLRTQKGIKHEKLVQSNRKLIKNDPLKRPIAIKKAKTPPPRSFKTDSSKVNLDSSESDILDTDYSEDETEDSDAYKDIPDRQFYVDDLPPEDKYAPGHGEEGPYDAKQRQAETLFQQYRREVSNDNIPSSSKKPITPNRPRNLPTGGLALRDKSSSRGKDEGVKENKGFHWKCPGKTPTRGKNGFKSDGEPVLADIKPKCPETHIGKIDLDSDDSFNDD
ncbi:uncharacterized protein LOC108140439 [Drosophila elegans]|uniref:uncharacterized protein LOC108140439 n=1 Tax=Drosophila elegans TaxID=30023 RepID=UPI0007E7FA21|nr:uncharacterized protein LOC108140439 [Drosophila elegans]